MIGQTIPLVQGMQDVTLTSYVLANSPEMMPDQARPAVIVCPGGAYLGCSDREAEPVALRFASMGYHAFVLRYATYGEGKPLGSKLPLQGAPPKPERAYPAPMLDIARAMLCLRENAAAWHVDTDRVALCGFSAGAHNCAMYGVSWHTRAVAESLGAPAAFLRPAAAILCYGLYDHALMTERIDAMDTAARQLLGMYVLALTGVARPDSATLAALSPAERVDGHMPPSFLWATAGDTLVPAEQTLRMAGALARAGVPYEAHVFEDGAHGLSLATQASAGARDQMDARAAKWMGLAETWLAKRFAPDVPRP